MSAPESDVPGTTDPATVTDHIRSGVEEVVTAWVGDARRGAAAFEPIASAWDDCAAEIPGADSGSWADRARGLERCLLRAEASLTGPLLKTVIAFDTAGRLEALARDLERSGVERARDAGSVRAADDGEGDFAGYLARRVIPDLVERSVEKAATGMLQAHADLASEATRWIRACARGLEEARRRAAAPPEPSPETVVDSPPAAEGSAEGADPRAESPTAGTPDGDGEAAAEAAPARPEEHWRTQLLEAGDALFSAVRAVGAAGEETGASIADDFGTELRDEVDAFDTRAGRRRARSSRSEEGAAGPPESPIEAWLTTLGLTRRFSAETARLKLCAEFVALEVYLTRFPSRILLRAADSAVTDAAEKLKGAVSRIRDLAGEVGSTFTDDRFDPPPDVLRILRSARGAITVARRSVEKTAEGDQIETGTAEGLGALLSRIGALPGPLLVARLVERGEPARLDVDGDELDMRAWASDAFGPALLDRLSTAADPCQAALEGALSAIPQALDILEYNLGAASSREELPEGDGDTLQAELILGGLTRTADLLDEAVRKMDESRTVAREKAVELVRDAARRLRDRAAAEAGVTGQAKDALDAVRRTGRRHASDVGRSWDAIEEQGRALARVATERLRGVLGRAQSAVGVSAADPARADDTTKTIADLDASAADLPFVYRRLFSYRALDDPTLLVGRDDEVGALDEHLNRWDEGSATGLLVVGTSGVGVSSLLKTTRERWYGRVDWREVAMTDRIEDEATLAGVLGRALEVEPSPTSLRALESELLRRERPAVPVVCALENLEHLYFRGVLARGLIAPMLRLVAATDPVVLWLASIPASAWEVVRATDPGLSALMRVIPINPLGREDVEAAVRARHRRSGIPIEFVESASMPIVARRALSKAGDPEARRAIIEKAFFDRVYALSEGHVALAMLYWLRSVRSTPKSDEMIAQWPEPLDFGAWDSLPSEATFGLRAFLEHGTLTTVEYARLFGVSETQGLAVFERLGAMLILEAAGDFRRVGEPLTFERVDPSRRYRIRPVLVRPVERLLRSRRLLY